MDKITFKVLSDGTQSWYKNGEFHRDDGPAVIWNNGSQLWYKDGILCRENGPAVIYKDGTQHWIKNGEFQWMK